ncbi:MAG: hypothetical protein WD716_04355 [Fimbriimonadaceae bacterium]
MGDDSISINLMTGFGWCAQHGPNQEPDGTGTFTYRYLPPGLWYHDPHTIYALINSAAKFFPTYRDFPKDLIPNVPEKVETELTKEGRRFYESCPMYALLEAKEPWLTWHQHHPKGGVPWTVRTNDYQAMMMQVIQDWPIDTWAEMFFEPWKEMLVTNNRGARHALYMQPALAEPAVPVIDNEGWSKDYDNARADIHERTDFPWGPYKVLLVSCDEDRVEGCKAMKFSDEFKLLPCSLAVRSRAGAPFVWREHHVFRIEYPLQLVPRMIKWTKDEEVAHPGVWSVKTVSPCYMWDVPEVRFQLGDVEEAGWDIIAVYYQPLAELDELALARYEHELAHLPRPPRP